MYEIYDYLRFLVVWSSGFLATFASTPLVMKIMRSLGIVGADVHKKNRPLIPEMGGLGTLTGLSTSIIAAMLLFPEQVLVFVSFLATTLLAGLVGAVDDLKTLNSKVKPFLTLFAGLPILLLRTYNPYLTLPVIGQARLTIVYPLVIPIVIAVTSNAVNMMDPFNGVMSGTCSIITFVLLVSAVFLNRVEAATICAGLLGTLLAFYYYNRYPAKTFSGDIGSLSIGAAIGAAAIIVPLGGQPSRLEIVAVVSFMPQIMNAFYGLSTIGRLYERREVPRPIRLLEDGRLMATEDRKAPITLARMILARGPLTEPEAVRVFLVLSAISGALALFTIYFLMVPV